MSLGKKHLLAVLLAALALIAWGYFGSKYALELTNYVLSSPKLTAPIRVVQLTDLHNSEFGENNERLVRMVKKQNPDVILLTGDMLNGDEPRTEVVTGLIEQLAAIAPVYASYGNHERANENVYGTDTGALYTQAGAHMLDCTFEDVEIRFSAKSNMTFVVAPFASEAEEGVRLQSVTVTGTLTYDISKSPTSEVYDLIAENGMRGEDVTDCDFRFVLVNENE